MIVRTDIPAWMVDVIEARARAAGISFDAALAASLEFGVMDRPMETAGWAVARGADIPDVAERLHWGERTVKDAAQRYRRHRANPD